MKRMVLSSESTDIDMYDPDILSVVPNSDEPTHVMESAQDLYESDPKFWDTYTQEILVSWRDETDKRSFWVLQVFCYYNKSNTVQFRKKGRCPATTESVLQAGEELKSRILDYYKSKYEEKQKKDDLKKLGKRRMTASAYTHLVIKQELGVTPTFYYSDTHKSMYMLYDLPFTDRENRTLYTEDAEEFKEKFQNILNRLTQELGFKYYDVSFPSGGTVIRGCWQFTCYGDDVIYDKRNNSVEVVED